jgi:hypothetical protein
VALAFGLAIAVLVGFLALTRADLLPTAALDAD